MPTEPPSTMDDDALDRALSFALREGAEPAVPMRGPALRARAASARASVPWTASPPARAALVAVAAVMTLSWGVSLVLAPDPDVELTPRAGAPTGPGAISASLVAVLDGTTPQRLPRVGGEVPSGGSVVFQVLSEAAGFACIEESAEETGPWRRVAGSRRAPLRVEQGTPDIPRARGVPQAFSTDAGPGTHAYRLLVHPVDAGCARASVADSLTLTWSAAQ